MENLAGEDLVRLCQRALPGDPRPFELLVARYKDRVYATAYRLMGNAQEAEDVAQEVFLKVYRGIKNLEEPATVTSWIYRITTTTSFDAIDKRQRRPATQSITPVGEDGEEELRYADTATATPEEAALRAELRECLEATMNRLDSLGRAVLVLRDVEGRPYQEIAESLKVSLSAVKMRIHRARLAFQEAFEHLCPEFRQGGQVDHVPS